MGRPTMVRRVLRLLWHVLRAVLAVGAVFGPVPPPPPPPPPPIEVVRDGDAEMLEKE
jgi:hypothetical protein